MEQLAKQGAGIIMISSELPEVLNMSDRILVMYNGQIVKEFARAEATQEAILSYAIGGGEESAKYAKELLGERHESKIRTHYEAIRNFCWVSDHYRCACHSLRCVSHHQEPA